MKMIRCKYPCPYTKNLCCHNCDAEGKCSIICTANSETCGFSIKDSEKEKENSKENF